MIDDRCQMRAETVWLTLQKMGNGGDRVVAIALRLGSRQQRVQGAIAGQRKPVKLGHCIPGRATHAKAGAFAYYGSCLGRFLPIPAEATPPAAPSITFQGNG